jgi:hypothetical protein
MIAGSPPVLSPAFAHVSRRGLLRGRGAGQVSTLNVLDTSWRAPYAPGVSGGTYPARGAESLFNVLNSHAILTNQTFQVNGPWLAPQSVLTPRFVKVSAQIDF